MELKLCEFETCRQLKEIGFNEPCSYRYVQAYGNSEYLKKMHGQLARYDVSNEYGDVIGFNKYRTSKGQPHIVSAPEQALVQTWLREEHDIYITIETKSYPEYYGDYEESPEYIPKHRYRIIRNIDNFRYNVIECSSTFDTYEQALETGILECVKLLKINISSRGTITKKND